MGIQFFDQVENIVEKGEIARYEQFLLFPQCFQKQYLWSKGLNSVKFCLFIKELTLSQTSPGVYMFKV